MSDLLRTYYDQPWFPGMGAPPLPPTVTALSPTSIVVNTLTTVTVTGTNFLNTSQVTVDGVAQETTYVSATSLTYQAIASAVGTQTVGVSGATGTIELTVTATAAEEAALPPPPAGGAAKRAPRKNGGTAS